MERKYRIKLKSSSVFRIYWKRIFPAFSQSMEEGYDARINLIGFCKAWAGRLE
jgi:hypothetical protein